MSKLILFFQTLFPRWNFFDEVPAKIEVHYLMNESWMNLDTKMNFKIFNLISNPESLFIHKFNNSIRSFISKDTHTNAEIIFIRRIISALVILQSKETPEKLFEFKICFKNPNQNEFKEVFNSTKENSLI